MRRSLHMRVGACVRVFPLGFVSSLTVSFLGCSLGSLQSPTPCEAYALAAVVTQPRAKRPSGEVYLLCKAVHFEPTFGLSAIARCTALWTD